MTHAEQLKAELAKVPKGCRYIDSPNWAEISRLLKEGTPYIEKRPVN